MMCIIFIGIIVSVCLSQSKESECDVKRPSGTNNDLLRCHWIVSMPRSCDKPVHERNAKYCRGLSYRM